MIKVKAFIEALNAFYLDIKKSKSYLNNDKRLTSAEKKILHCFFLLRDNKFSEIIETLFTISTDYDPVVTSQKLLLLGITYNNKSEFLKSSQFLEDAIKAMEPYPLPRQKFVAHDALFAAYFNLKNIKKMKSTFALLSNFPITCDVETISILRDECMLALFNEDTELAKITMDKLDMLKNKMTEVQTIGILVLKFNYFIKLENIDGCEEVLEELKKFRKFNYSANFAYMRSLLEFFANQAPIYVYDSNFEGFPYLLNQVKFIKAREEQNNDLALAVWKELQLMSPETYGNDFTYNGDKNLFSLCLKKLKAHKTQNTIEINHKEKEDHLLSLLMNSKAPMRKEDLYCRLWGNPPTGKADFNKLAQMVSRLRSKTIHEIKSQKGCYFIECARKKIS